MGRRSSDRREPHRRRARPWPHPRVALLLVIPVLAALTLPPSALGSFAASRGSGTQRLLAAGPTKAKGGPADLPPMTIPQATAFNTGTIPPTGSADSSSQFEPMPPPRDGATDLTLADYVTRSLFDPARALGTQPVRLVGFVTSRSGGGFRLTHFSIACCAADGYPIQVDIVGAAGILPAADKWVEVVGRYEPGVDDDVPRLRDISVTRISQPAEPYE